MTKLDPSDILPALADIEAQFRAFAKQYPEIADEYIRSLGLDPDWFRDDAAARRAMPGESTTLASRGRTRRGPSNV